MFVQNQVRKHLVYCLNKVKGVMDLTTIYKECGADDAGYNNIRSAIADFYQDAYVQSGYIYNIPFLEGYQLEMHNDYINYSRRRSLRVKDVANNSIKLNIIDNGVAGDTDGNDGVILSDNFLTLILKTDDFSKTYTFGKLSNGTPFYIQGSSLKVNPYVGGFAMRLSGLNSDVFDENGIPYVFDHLLLAGSANTPLLNEDGSFATLPSPMKGVSQSKSYISQTHMSINSLRLLIPFDEYVAV